MAYDRYDERGGERSRWREDDRAGRRFGGESGGHGERGFLERAKDEVSSWFGDDEGGQRRMQDDRSGGRDNMNWSRGGSSDYRPSRYEGDEQRRYGGSSYGREGERFGRDDDRYAGRSGYGRDEDDRGGRTYRSGGETMGDRGRTYPGTLGQTVHRNRDDDHGGVYSRDEGSGREYARYRAGGGGSDRPQRSGMGAQDFARSQYGRQDFSQDQDNDRNYGRTYNQGGWGDRDSQRQSYGGDDHYNQWRQRQMEELDRDYHDYRREHQSRFANEFSGWRSQRQSKRQMLSAIREHMEVVDENGEHIGAVDKVRGDQIILTRNDPAAGGVHRSLSCSLLNRVEDKVYLSGTAATIRNQLHEQRDDDRDGRGSGRGGGILGGLFGGGRSDDGRRGERSTTNRAEGDGPHVLDRSFSGTYDEGDRR